MHSAAFVRAQQELWMIFVIFLLGTLGGKIAEKLRLPDVVVYVLLGLLVGPMGLGWVDVPTDSISNQMVLVFGSAFILFHGGTITSMGTLKRVWMTVSLLSTLGVVLTALLVGVFAHWVFPISFVSALLMGAMIASTDPSALVPIFKSFPVRPKVAQTVITESAFTDATGAILTIVLLGILVGGNGQAGLQGIGHVLLQFLLLSFGGMVVGGIAGGIGAWLISEHDRGLLKDFAPMVAILLVLGSYLGAEMIHASGYMSVFVAGLMMGNAKALKLTVLPRVEQSMHEYIDVISLKCRMLIFILLGTQMNFAALRDWFWQSVLVVVLFMLVARPLTVLACLLPDRKAKWERKEIVFLFWTRETGVIPAALAGIIAGMGVQDAGIYQSVVVIAILATLLIQASTTPYLASRLGLIVEKK
jgi:cell volume regulation protein A